MRPLRIAAGVALSIGLVAGPGVAADAPRAARSVHLGYPAPEARTFTIDLRVEKSVPGNYFMACGFSDGYFGIQEQGGGRKVALFSVWDPTAGDNPNAVPSGQRVEVPYQAGDVTVRRFGGEGTGGQCFLPFDWKPGATYRFTVRATVSGRKTAYAAYLYMPDTRVWKHLVTFRTTTGGHHLRGLYSFIEDFRRDTASAGEIRRATFGNGWVQATDGKWQPLTRARFTASGAPWEARETIDAGTSGGRFYLQTGGETKTTSPLDSMINLPEAKRTPPRF